MYRLKSNRRLPKARNVSVDIWSIILCIVCLYVLYRMSVKVVSVDIWSIILCIAGYEAEVKKAEAMFQLTYGVLYYV